jgi:hypothetical protein
MKARKPHIKSNRDTQTMTRKDEVAISRLRTDYCRAAHAAIMNRKPRPECLLCGVPLTIDHILCQCKETKEEMTTEVWKEEDQNYITEYNREVICN